MQISVMVNKIINKFDLLVVLGPTATGKTKLAVNIAADLNGEIISVDSRQVYKGMDIGTGKDLEEYKLKGKTIPYHLIDIVNPNEEYNVFHFKKDFQTIFPKLLRKRKLPILCGGTGFYIKAILMDFQLPNTTPNFTLRKELETWEREELIKELNHMSPDASQHKNLETKRRIIRAIEIELSGNKINLEKDTIPKAMSKVTNPLVLGIKYPREIIRERITNRLHERLDQGMIQEVESLLENNITYERLEQLGLEYRFISYYLLGKLSQDTMIEKLNIAIHQFAKRQMTFFRNIEKNGIKITWIPEGKLDIALEMIHNGYADTLWMLNKSIQARYFWNYVLKLDSTEQKLKDVIIKKLVFGITKKL